jgi:plasmid maintenance system antidote protein VapI
MSMQPRPATPQALFEEFVSVLFEGSRARAARALEIDASLVTRICQGDRTITPDVALKIEQVSSGRYRKEGFIWPEETPAAAAAALQP